MVLRGPNHLDLSAGIARPDLVPRASKERLQPLTSFRKIAAHPPEPPESAAQLETFLHRPLRQVIVDGRAAVVMLIFQSLQPLHLRGTLQFRRGMLRQSQEVPRVL